MGYVDAEIRLPIKMNQLKRLLNFVKNKPLIGFLP